MEMILKEYSVNCTHCGAKVDSPCLRSDGVVLKFVVHPAREKLYAIVNDPKYRRGRNKKEK